MAGNCVSKGNFRRTKKLPTHKPFKNSQSASYKYFSQETYMIHANCLAQTKEYT